MTTVTNAPGQKFQLTICCARCAPEYDRLRSLYFPGTDCALVCFSMVDRSTMEHVKTKWLAELETHGLFRVAIILVGTQSDRVVPTEATHVQQAEAEVNETRPNL